MAETNWRELCRELAQHAANAQLVLAGEGLWDGDEDDGLLERATAAIEADELAVIERGIAADCARAALVQPAPPVAGEVGELVAWLSDEADQYDCISQAPEASRKLRRAADLLAQRHPEPVPVAERLPGPENCDAEGRCWWFCLECPGEHSYWILAKEVYCEPTYWLPVTALPLPQGEVE